MTKRTQTTKTTIYRRHAASCPIKEQPLNTANCECPLWIHGRVRGKKVRESLDTRTLSTAEMRQTAMENGRDDDPTPNGGLKVVHMAAGTETLEYAAAEFLKMKQKLSTNSKKLYKGAVEDFTEWAAKKGIVSLKAVNSDHVREYLEVGRTWKRNTAQSRLTLLRVFFNWTARTKHWIPFPPTEDQNLNQNGKKKGGSSSKRVPFTPEQVTMILAAVERMPEKDRDRARALVYLLLFTGMRISDATFCERSYLTAANDMDYYVIKTRREITLPPGLEEPAVAALKKLPPSRVYFFQPDQNDDYRDARTALKAGEEFSTLIPNYDARVRETTALVLKVLKLAGVTGACHRFRDTFAINLLVGDGEEKKTDIYTVSQMLGHSDVKITINHYMKLVPGYRERMSKATRVLSYVFPKLFPKAS